jgi:hypothetical protein
MAHIIPETPVGNVTPEVARAFRALKALPDHWYIWLHLTPWEPDAPDFLLLDPEQRALLLKVSQATALQAQQAPQLQLLDFEQETPVPGEAEEQCLQTFLEQVEQAGVPCDQVHAAVLFPNLAAQDLRAIQKSETTPRFVWLDKHWINSKSAEEWKKLFPAEPLAAAQWRALRGQFAPETVVPAAFVARTATRRRNLQAELTRYLLDYNQERILKTDLDLAPAGEHVARDVRIQVVNGVTGSGKTLVLLYRLRLLQARFPRKTYLVLTHNRPLIREMRARYQLLTGTQSPTIQWQTFMGWCRRHWPNDQPYNPISIRKRKQLLRNIWYRELQGTSITPGMFQSELEWVKDTGLTKREAYLEISRRGRGFRLTEPQRVQIFDAMQAYQQRLLDQQVMDWWDVPRRYWHWLAEGRVAPPQYDVVLVDEAQFFAPIWFDIVRQLILPEHGYLFLAADPTQGFLRRSESWRSITGLEVRGRTYHLRRSYRTTRAILTCALAFYRQRLPEEEPDLLLPDLHGMEEGHPPWLLHFTASQDERARLVAEIVRAVDKGLPRQHILILHADARGATALIAALNKRLGEGAARDPKDELPGEFIRVTTLSAATGLESPVVFIAGMHELFEREGSLRLAEDEQAELVQMHTRQLYMAFTRAGQRLVLTYVGEIPESFQELQKYELINIM